MSNINKKVWCWVNGWLYLLHPETVIRAQDQGFDWVRPAEDGEVETFFAKTGNSVEVGK